MSSADPIPWNSPGFPGAKPALAPSGHVRERVSIPADDGALAVAVRRDRADLVWTPELPSLAPPEAFPSLREPARERLRHRARETLRWSMICLAFCAALVYRHWIAARDPGEVMIYPPLDLLLFLCVACGLLPFGMGLRVGILAESTSERTWVALADDARFDIWIRRRIPWVTWGLAALLVAVALAEIGGCGAGRAVAAGGARAARIAAGDWLPLLGAPLLHVDLTRALVCAFGLWLAGRVAEPLAGRAAALAGFVLPAIAGTLVAAALVPGARLAGAIPGVAGLIALLAVHGWDRRRALPHAFWWSLIGASGFAIAAGSLLAWRDAGPQALAGGALCGASLGPLTSPARPVARLALGWLSAAALCAGAWLALRVALG